MMKKIEIDYQFDMFQPSGDPFILAVKDPKNPLKYLGWAILDFMIMDDLTKNYVHLWFIYTLPDYRRKGYASALLREMQKKHDYIETNVVSLNGEGEALCLANDFKLIKSIHKNRLDTLVWKKKPTSESE